MVRMLSPNTLGLIRQKVAYIKNRKIIQVQSKARVTSVRMDNIIAMSSAACTVFRRMRAVIL